MNPAAPRRGERKGESAMDVILLERVKNLGTVGDQVAVKPGYGRNFLVPQGKAVPATKANVAEFEAKRAELEARAQDVVSAATTRKEALTGMKVTIPAKVGAEGKLFGSVGNREIAEALSASGVKVDKAEVRLAEGSFRVCGEYEVQLHLHSDVDAVVTIEVVPE